MSFNPAALRALLEGDMHNARVAMTPGGIEAQEAAGQAAMVATSQLPIEGMDRAKLESLGFTIGRKVDDLFVAVTLPEGWELKATSHSMHSDILDNKGRKRGGVFFKAAFYDTRADMHLLRRLTVQTIPCDINGDVCDYREAGFRAIVIMDADDNTPIHHIAINNHEAPRDKAYWTLMDEQDKEARAWLDGAYPDHNDVLAYWD